MLTRRRGNTNRERSAVPAVGDARAGFMYTSRFGSYPFQKTQMLKITANENAPFEECNQRCLGSCDSEAPLHLSPHKQKPSSAWREAAAAAAISRGPAAAARPCFTEFTIIGAHV